MKILQQYPEQFTKRALYALTMSPKIGRMKDAKGSKLDVSAWVIYEDTDKDGEARKVLAVCTPEQEVFATNSTTFMDDFLAMVDLFGAGGVDRIEVISGMSKNGREYITCAYAGD